jgi:hypothetical protein
MKQGFLLSCKTANKSDDHSGHDKRSLGPLRDDRIDRSGTGWGSLSQLSGRVYNSDPWVDPTESITMNLQCANEQAKPIGDTESIKRTSSKYIPFSSAQNLPYKTFSVPMNALGCYYGKYYNNVQIKMSEYYFSWNDQNPKSHLLRWTCVFLCPISGEIFVTGSWPNNDPLPMIESQSLPAPQLPKCDEKKLLASPSFSSPPLQTRWMKTKKSAEHGAAAWAYDCFQHRHRVSLEPPLSGVPKATSMKNIMITAPIGKETPYVERMAIQTVPEFVPDTIRVRIEECRENILNGALQYKNSDVLMEMEEELAWHSQKNCK